MEAKQGAMWRPTEREQRAYTYLLSILDPHKEGVIEGQAAVPFFQKSGLPDAVLGGIWQLADTDSKGHLTTQEFGVAMKLISLSQANRPVMLSSLTEDVNLPELRGISWQQVLSSPISTSMSGTHGRRDSNTSSIGWTSMMGTAAASQASLSEAVVSPKEKQQYTQIFEKSGPVDGAISGAAARALFTKTKLTNEQLGRVWMLADPHSEGKLRLPGFIVAMYFIRRIMENRSIELPHRCPASLWRSAGGDPRVLSPVGSMSQTSLTSMSTPDLADAQWDVTKEEWQRYEQFFNSLDTQRVGYLSGDVPVNFFLKSKLPESLLSKVWDLADIRRSGRLSKEEFAVAMHLINARLLGGQIPDRLPPTLVPPSMRRAAISSSSMQNLSPTLRPTSARDRVQLADNLKRSTSYAAGRPAVPASMSRVSTARSTAMSPPMESDELTSLQTQLGQMEDISRGLQTQRTETANQLAQASTRKQELEGRLIALQSSHDVEQRVNQELKEKLKAEESQVAVLQSQVSDANKRLSVVSAQHAQLEQDVHRVQTQQAALAQRLQQAQEDERQMHSEISTLEQRKQMLEQKLVETQSQIAQLQKSNQEMQERVHTLTQETDALTRQVSEAEKEATELTAQIQVQRQAINQKATSGDRESLSFDDIFGTGESQPATAEGAAFSSSGEFISAGTDPRSESLPQHPSTSSETTATISGPAAFAPMPPLDTTLAGANSTDAFDSFGAHSADPFEEFLQSTVTEPSEKRASENTQQFDAVFAPSAVTRSQTKPIEATRAMSDPRSVTSTPAPSSSHATPAAETHNAAKSTPSSPPTATKSNDGLAATSGQGFAADFTAVFGEIPSASERAINQDIAAFKDKFPDISSLSVSENVTEKPITEAKSEENEELTFESVFGSGDNTNDTESKGKDAEVPPPTSDPAAAKKSDKKDEDSKSSKTESSEAANKSVDDDDFVPPPVVKRTNVSARPMSRVLSIFRSSSSSGTRGSGLLSGGPTLPKRSATERRQQQLKEQDRKFEEQWAKGDWPDWVKKGEFFYERKMLLEMGYPKDRVVEALEVNDFNLAQATDYLLSC
ncbi:hypothetical protein IWW36_000778 [Coemansia brasiliensis]|uniref:Uncharacterized protein n=1 Tax=Coemansia brasiliensis TaxID=2650707 RepID=A0A9W8IA62_9FUNG|nr:hypothetical protein IWW36_000778 [Coemansia brasiliensis]